MAPELLRCGGRSTCPSDIYSFGIVLFEMYARETPYQGEDSETVLREVADATIAKRPKPPPGCPLKIKLLMNDCLEDDPQLRPSSEEINMQLRRMNIETARETPKSLSDKTEALLFDVFPKHVAKALRNGETVQPEQRDCVTIFFSDVVGYTKISSTLTPIKVSDLLGRLYSRFDALLDCYGVFKVETIVRVNVSDEIFLISVVQTNRETLSWR